MKEVQPTNTTPNNIPNVYIYSDVDKNANGGISRTHFDTKRLMKFKNEIEKIYNKNGIKINVIVTSYEEMMKTKDNRDNQNPTDAFVMFTDANMPSIGNSSICTGSLHTGAINLGMTYVSLGRINADKEIYGSKSFDNKDMDYVLSYLAAHEILHQFITKANLYFYGKDVGPDHENNSGHNLNEQGDYVIPAIPSRSTQTLQQAERILPKHKKLIKDYFITEFIEKNKFYFKNFKF